MGKKAPKYLTNAKKIRILQEIDRRNSQGESFTLVNIAIWAKDKFKLPFSPSSSTISHLRSSAGNIRKRGLTSQKKSGPLVSSALDAKLAQWVCNMESRRLAVMGDMIKEKGARLLVQVNEQLPESKQLKLNFSNGWLQQFKQRHLFRVHKSRGESGDADIAAIRQKLPVIKEKLASFALNDVFNADDFGHFYQLASAQTIARNALPCRKKVRMAYLACANADGTEKFPLMFIGRAYRPRSFRGKYGHELGFDYYFNNKAWMNSELFFAWLKHFDHFIGATPGRKAALLIDNCSAHGTAQTLPDLQHVEVIFLPPNTTSHIKPMDAGIIAALKTRYRRPQISRALGFLDSTQCTEDDVHKIDQLTAMRWMRDNWQEMKEETIFNCWLHTGIVDHLLGDSVSTTTTEMIERENTELAQLLAEVLPPRMRINIGDLVSPNEEDVCIADVEEATLVGDILHEMNPIETSEAAEIVEQENKPKLSLAEQLCHLSLALEIMDERGECS